MAFWAMTSLNLVGGYKSIIEKYWGEERFEVSPSTAVCISTKTSKKL
jgi:hypothetical protein